MEVVVLTIHLLVCVCLIGLVLLQRSEGGALGMGGGGGGSLMTGRGAADALAKMTSVAGGFFLVTSLSLTVLAGATASSGGSPMMDMLRNQSTQESPILAPPAADAPAETPADARPDPTESRAPASTQLASAIIPGPASASASEPARAAPIENRPTAAPASTQRVSAPATTQRASTPPQASGATTTPVTQRSTTATNPPAQRTTLSSTGARPTTPALTLPQTSGSGGLVATDPNAPQAESIQVGNGLEAVRRERAGPDQ